MYMCIYIYIYMMFNYGKPREDADKFRHVYNEL